MEEKQQHVYKMYGIVLRQLDGINSGVQTAHAVCEYIRKHWEDEDLQQWLNKDKTLIVLNGGTYKDLVEIMYKFKDNGIKYETFEEEDLDELTTCIAVLADERVWDKKEYGTIEQFVENNAKKILEDEDLQPKEWKSSEWEEAERELQEYLDREVNKQYEQFVGGRENVVKKEVLNNLRLV